MFHRHYWGIAFEKFNPHPENMTEFSGSTTEETYLMVVYGFTVITQRCYNCGEVKTEHVVGRTSGAH